MVLMTRIRIYATAALPASPLFRRALKGVFVATLTLIGSPLAFAQFAYECTPATGRPFVSKTPCPAGMMWTKIQIDPYYVEPKAATRAPSNVAPSSQTANDAARNQPLSPASQQMLAALTQAKSMASERPNNGALILSSALCGLWQTYPQPDQRQALLSQAKVLATEHPNNASLIMTAAMGRCPSSSPRPRQAMNPPTPIPQQNAGGIIDVTTGTFMPPAAGGVIDPRNGTFMSNAAGGVVNTRTGEFMPTH